jgi:hypothetical protein
MAIAYSTLTQLDEIRPKTISQLRTLEANAGSGLFQGGMPIKWRRISKRPIRETWQQIGQKGHRFFTSPEIVMRRIRSTQF